MTEVGSAGWPPGFADEHLLDVLEASDDVLTFDDLGFGLIVMDREGITVGYNVFESRRAGIAKERVLGRHFFTDVGPCTNNYLVAERYRAQPDLDEQLDYVFTFRMSPTPVRLRLLAKAGSPRQYLAITPR